MFFYCSFFLFPLCVSPPLYRTISFVVSSLMPLDREILSSTISLPFSDAFPFTPRLHCVEFLATRVAVV